MEKTGLGASVAFVAAVALPLSVHYFAAGDIASLVPHALLLNTFLFTGLLAAIAVACAYFYCRLNDEGKFMSALEFNSSSTFLNQRNSLQKGFKSLRNALFGAEKHRRALVVMTLFFLLLGLAADGLVAYLAREMSSVGLLGHWLVNTISAEFAQAGRMHTVLGIFEILAVLIPLFVLCGGVYWFVRGQSSESERPLAPESTQKEAGLAARKERATSTEQPAQGEQDQTGVDPQGAAENESHKAGADSEEEVEEKYSSYAQWLLKQLKAAQPHPSSGLRHFEVRIEREGIDTGHYYMTSVGDCFYNSASWIEAGHLNSLGHECGVLFEGDTLVYADTSLEQLYLKGKYIAYATYENPEQRKASALTPGEYQRTGRGGMLMFYGPDEMRCFCIFAPGKSAYTLIKNDRELNSDVRKFPANVGGGLPLRDEEDVKLELNGIPGGRFARQACFDFDLTLTGKPQWFSADAGHSFGEFRADKCAGISPADRYRRGRAAWVGRFQRTGSKQAVMQYGIGNFAVATYHNNPDFVAGVLAEMLGVELTLNQKIQRTVKDQNTGAEACIAINEYTVEGGETVAICYIDSQNKFSANKNVLDPRKGRLGKDPKISGKNAMIQFLRDSGFLRNESVDYYDDSKDNLVAANAPKAEMAGVNCYLVPQGGPFSAQYLAPPSSAPVPEQEDSAAASAAYAVYAAPPVQEKPAAASLKEGALTMAATGATTLSSTLR